MNSYLPKELTALVDWSVTELGRVIQSELGTRGFQRIEHLRRHVKSPQGQTLSGLLQMKRTLQKLSPRERYEVAHAFALMLELINACESAYRAYALQRGEKNETDAAEVPYGKIIHVLTAHPTESRSSQILHYFKRIQGLLQAQLAQPRAENHLELFLLLKLAWRIPMSKQRKPTVMDEAEYIYTLVLQRDIIEIYLKKYQQELPFFIRTWVGGDKDGHPGVDEKTMLGSLQMSRGLVLGWLKEELKSFVADLTPVAESPSAEGKKLQRLLAETRELKKLLPGLKRLQAGDAGRVEEFKKIQERIAKTYLRILKMDSVRLNRIRRLVRIFPGLVVPLELREDSSLVHQALKDPRPVLNIARMLRTLGGLCAGHDPRLYVGGFVLSRAESEKDILAGARLAQRYLRKDRLPVIPLFESAHSLENADQIIERYFQLPGQRRRVQRDWDGKFEVMLGYSDSAKESGSLASKVLIQSAMAALEKKIRSFGLTPIFFHGSGGSVERGGGSVQDQTAWWPFSALATAKVTVQGEMIYRGYSSPEVLRRQLEYFEEARRGRKENFTPSLSAADQKALETMALATRSSYQEILQEPSFLEVIELATPYTFLKNLKMGSRPSKRQGALEIQNLRAIPWVLCWTQTRTLFPSWWGVGSFWDRLSRAEKEKYKDLFKRSSFFASFIRLLAFTLAKMDLNIFAMYLQSSRLPKDLARQTEGRFRREFALCRQAIQEITGEKDLLWYRRWLQDSIRLRSPLIHPLNALQLIALQDNDILLLRETVTGVASGMLTTG